MKYTEALGFSARSCFAGLLIGGYISSLVLSILLSYERHAPLLDWLKTPLQALVVLLFASGFAVLPVALLAMPTYALLVQRERATYWSALAILLIFSGVVWLLTEANTATFVALFGVPIALVTHQAYKVGSNNSFKPKPLRGSA